MRKSTTIYGGIVLFSLLSAGCYNNPHRSELVPGQGPDNHMSGPAVGPGTTAGGSTAGPQPARAEASGHAAATPAEHAEPAKH